MVGSVIPQRAISHLDVPHELSIAATPFFGDRHGWGEDAVVQVILHNNSQGYEFDEYGRSFTVRRTIEHFGGGGFALIGHDGDVSAVGGCTHVLLGQITS